ncbi:MAG: TlpA disulfide reductase family protein [Polaromonas sp.]|uniref:TlpA disulfide reductase family protein n=1 Tax=Polaromonas sp. TaxID=1869339 RepID=UPI0027308962|nr:TlpA disulfide reductase family protein [Polaromonas sp.]MDP1742680.1 TlpA disulfide reductase family protein [Polaromonas sp.]MDP1954795.1 TlpA disulfide reductase family protein [Polaromonas sp.]MDP3354837.1 TlpA disulfide reductase family protein [Polaromonas sp.]MDP3753396.1 TlpA disulfide reductase family protein [Polaromonas sp.]
MFERRQIIQSAAALAAAGLCLPALARGSSSPLPAVGSTLLLPAVTLLDGAVWTPAKVAGKVLVVYWWASWCPFCAVQSPHMEALWRAQKARGLEVLALSIDKDTAAAVNYMKAKGYSFPAGMLSPEVVRVLPKPDGLPVVVVLKVNKNGRDGKVLFAEAGEMFPEDVEGLKKYL